MNLFTNQVVLGIILGIPMGVLLILKFSSGVANYQKHLRKVVHYLRFIPFDEISSELKNEGISLGQNTKCSVCGRIITTQNFGAVRKKGHEQVFVCSSARCMTLGKIVSTK